MFKQLSKKLTVIATGLSVLAISTLGISPVFAASPGQLAGGTGLYLVKNLTQSGSYASSISAASCDEVQYSMMLSNTQYGSLNNVTVNATLSSGGGTSTFTATTDLGGTSGTSDSAVVNVASGRTISYENGTTVLYDGSGNAIRTLSDGITSGGLNIGTIVGSTTEFVNFKAKVSCAPVVPATYTATASATATATASATATCPAGQGGGSATSSASGSATASANATSNVSQADADQKAHDAAVQAATPTAQANAQANANATAQASVKCSSAVVTAVKSAPTVTALPNTGPGDVLGAFFGTSAIGTVVHSVISRRRR